MVLHCTVHSKKKSRPQKCDRAIHIQKSSLTRLRKHHDSHVHMIYISVLEHVKRPNSSSCWMERQKISMRTSGHGVCVCVCVIACARVLRLQLNATVVMHTFSNTHPPCATAEKAPRAATTSDHVSALSGQPIHVCACGSHSAGIRRPDPLRPDMAAQGMRVLAFAQNVRCHWTS